MIFGCQLGSETYYSSRNLSIDLLHPKNMGFFLAKKPSISFFVGIYQRIIVVLQ